MEFERLAHHAIPKKPIIVKTVNEIRIPAAGRDYIVWPKLFLMKTKDLPKKFIVTGIEDPKLRSDAFLQEVADFSYEFLSIPKRPLTTEEKSTVRLCVLFFRNSGLSEDAKKSILYHEAGHIFYEHPGSNPFFINAINSLSCAVSGSVMGALYFLLPATHPVPEKEHIALLAATLVTAYVFSYTMISSYASLFQKNQEKQADLWSAKKAPQLVNGHIYLHACRTQLKGLEKTLSWKARLFLNLFEIYPFHTHPTAMARMEYLKKAISQA